MTLAVAGELLLLCRRVETDGEDRGAQRFGDQLGAAVSEGHASDLHRRRHHPGVEQTGNAERVGLDHAPALPVEPGAAGDRVEEFHSELVERNAVDGVQKGGAGHLMRHGRITDIPGRCGRLNCWVPNQEGAERPLHRAGIVGRQRGDLAGDIDRADAGRRDLDRLLAERMRDPVPARERRVDAYLEAAERDLLARLRGAVEEHRIGRHRQRRRGAARTIRCRRHRHLGLARPPRGAVFEPDPLLVACDDRIGCDVDGVGGRTEPAGILAAGAQRQRDALTIPVGDRELGDRIGRPNREQLERAASRAGPRRSPAKQRNGAHQPSKQHLGARWHAPATETSRIDRSSIQRERRL